jgi:hypothetical protein
MHVPSELSTIVYYLLCSTCFVIRVTDRQKRKAIATEYHYNIFKMSLEAMKGYFQSVSTHSVTRFKKSSIIPCLDAYLRQL